MVLCNCYCCNTSTCSATYAGSFETTSCYDGNCRSTFPGACPSSGGYVRAEADYSPSTPFMSLILAFPIIAIVICVIFIYCLVKRYRNMNRQPYYTVHPVPSAVYGPSYPIGYNGYPNGAPPQYYATGQLPPNTAAFPGQRPQYPHQYQYYEQPNRNYSPQFQNQSGPLFGQPFGQPPMSSSVGAIPPANIESGLQPKKG